MRNRLPAEKCKAFNGLVHEICENGVSYDTVKVFNEPPGTGIKLPCFSELSNCPKAEFYTLDEVEQREKEREARMRQVLDDLKNNICPTHKIPITKRQVGRCVYADECGCRLYQGKA